MKFAVEIGSCVIIYIPSFIKNWFSHSEVNVGGYTDTQTAR
jgi:hypothetical protein